MTQASNALGTGGGTGRKRTALANILSKYRVDYQNPGGLAALPSTTPEQTQNYYQQLGGLYSQYQTLLGGLRQQRMGIKANAMTQRADVRAQTVQGVVGAEQAAQDRGVLGSSGDLSARAGVRAAGAQGLAQVKSDALSKLADLQLQKQQGALALYQGTTSLAGQQLAQQQQALAMQLQNNLIVSGQETQMDAMQAIYAALAGRAGGGRGGGGAPRGVSRGPYGPAALGIPASSLSNYFGG
jgi:hypothetical protein